MTAAWNLDFSLSLCSKCLTYTGVLQRHESLAANLGAKLVGPLLLRTLEKLFDGPIKVIQTSFELAQGAVTWLDIVTFARTNAADFVLLDTPHGKVCRVWIKGGQIEISEDDYRLILSGAPDRVIPIQPIAEDEAAELGTLNILEGRLAMLIKKADAVASKARQLNYHLKGRKTAVLARKAESSSTVPEQSTDPRPFSPQPFSAINSREPKSGDAKLQQDLLEQFTANERVDRRGSVAHTPRPKASRAAATATEIPFNGEADARRMSHPATSSDDGVEGQYRILMAAKIEKLARGDIITPPCDRCRRLKFDCTKHLTACSACTKKHAKCSWKDLKDGELEATPTTPGPNLVVSIDNGYKSDIASPGLSTGQGQILNAEGGDQKMNEGSLVYPSRPDDFTMLAQIATAATASN